MSRIMTTIGFGAETYFCYKCAKDLSVNDIDCWCCKGCGERVRIDAGLGKFIMRKFPEDVTKRDIIVLSDKKFYELYKVEKKNRDIHYTA